MPALSSSWGSSRSNRYRSAVAYPLPYILHMFACPSGRPVSLLAQLEHAADGTKRLLGYVRVYGDLGALVEQRLVHLAKRA